MADRCIWGHHFPGWPPLWPSRDLLLRPGTAWPHTGKKQARRGVWESSLAVRGAVAPRSISPNHETSTIQSTRSKSAEELLWADFT